MSVVSRAFVPVSIRDGECPNDKWHFRGAAREVYSYLKVLAQHHGGFVFAGVEDITKHTKNWSKGRKPFSASQCERILRIFYELGILGEREKRKIHGRWYWGRQFANHAFWAESLGDICDFKHWEAYAAAGHRFMGNNDGSDDGHNDGDNDGQIADNDGPNDGLQSLVLTPIAAESGRLRERAAS